MSIKKNMRRTVFIAIILLAVGSISGAANSNLCHPSPQTNSSSQSEPRLAPARWLGLIGEYGPDDNILIILEKDGNLVALLNRQEAESLDEVGRSVFKFREGSRAGQRLVFVRDSRARATQVAIDESKASS